MEDACLACRGKLFQRVVPLYERHFCLFDISSLVSVDQSQYFRVRVRDVGNIEKVGAPYIQGHIYK